MYYSHVFLFLFLCFSCLSAVVHARVAEHSSWLCLPSPNVGKDIVASICSRTGLVLQCNLYAWPPDQPRQVDQRGSEVTSTTVCGS